MKPEQPAQRVVITGIGVIAGNGLGKDAFWDAVLQGAGGIKPVSLFNAGSFNNRLAGEISQFDPAQILGPKGLRTLDRSTRLACSAAKLALDDAGVVINESNNQDVGVVLGTNLGSLHSIVEFDRTSIVEGPQYVNPAFFPNTVINSPASQVSIKFNIKGFNTTVANGFCSGLDALGYAANFLRQGRSSMVLAGGVEELCEETFLGFHNAKCLSGGESVRQEFSCPFDKRRNGLILGEGVGLLVLEEFESALRRRATIYGEILGFGQGFDAQGVVGYNPQGAGLKRAMRAALDKAGVGPQDIDYICAAANSSLAQDKIEAQAIREVFGSLADKVPVGAIKSMTGECVNASGAMQLAAGLGAIHKQAAFPTTNYQEADPACDLNHVKNISLACKINTVMINGMGPGGNNSAMVVSRCGG